MCLNPLKTFEASVCRMMKSCLYQGCGVARSRFFLGAVGFLRTLGVGCFYPTPTPEVQLNHFLHCTPKLGILNWLVPVEMLQFRLKFLLKQRIIAVQHDFRWLLVATKLLTAKLHSCYAKESKPEILERLESVSEILEWSDILPPTPQPWFVRCN